MDKKSNIPQGTALEIDDRIKNLELAIQNLIEKADQAFVDDQYYGIECAFILDHALNIKMHFYSKYPELAPPHLKGVVKTYDRIVHIREENLSDRLVQIDSNYHKE